jgi:hypothetical protein
MISEQKVSSIIVTSHHFKRSKTDAAGGAKLRFLLDMLQQAVSSSCVFKYALLHAIVFVWYNFWMAAATFSGVAQVLA